MGIWLTHFALKYGFRTNLYYRIVLLINIITYDYILGYEWSWQSLKEYNGIDVNMLK